MGIRPVWGKLIIRDRVTGKLMKLKLQGSHLKGSFLDFSKALGGALIILHLYFYVLLFLKEAPQNRISVRSLQKTACMEQRRTAPVPCG